MTSSKKSLREVKSYPVDFFCKNYDLKLDANENLFGPSPKVIEAIRNVEASDLYSYPAYGALYQGLSSFNNIGMENLAITNGADEAMFAILQTFLDENDVVLSANPTFVMPRIYSKILGVGFKDIKYEKRWRFPTEKLIENITQNTKIIILTTPNNPTGDVIPFSDVEKILNAAKDKVVVIDEVYANFSDVSYKELLFKYDNALIVRSFSKDFALAGLRIGYVMGAQRLITEIKKVLSPYNVNNLAVKAACVALDDFAHFKAQKNEFLKSKQELTTILESFGGVVFESHANFLCVDFKEKAFFIYKSLLDSGIKVRLFENDEMMDGILRITVPPMECLGKIRTALKTKKTIIFDMDGVLVDTSMSYRLAIKKTYEYFGQKPISLEQIQSAKNLGGLNNDWDLTEYLLKKDNINISKSDIIDKFQDFYWNSQQGLINDEALALDKSILLNLSKDYHLAIFTGRPRQEAIFTLQKFGIKDLFYPIITMDDLPYNRQKPDSLGVEVIQSKIITNEIYYLGDSLDDMKSASSAKVNGIGILPPQDKSPALKEGLIKNGAVIVLDDVNKISEYMESCRV